MAVKKGQNNNLALKRLMGKAPYENEEMNEKLSRAIKTIHNLAEASPEILFNKVAMLRLTGALDNYQYTIFCEHHGLQGNPKKTFSDISANINRAGLKNIIECYNSALRIIAKECAMPKKQEEILTL